MPPVRPIIDTNITSENRKKSLELTVDSLKLYITLSTVSIAGLLGLYNLSDTPRNINLLWFSIISFLACAITSVININMFINSVYDDNYDIRKNLFRKVNLLAIILFALAIAAAVAYIFSNQNKGVKKNDHVQLTIGDKSIELPPDSATVAYKLDSGLNILSLQINPPKIPTIQYCDTVRSCCHSHCRTRHHRTRR
jgi:hypothetical protein